MLSASGSHKQSAFYTLLLSLLSGGLFVIFYDPLQHFASQHTLCLFKEITGVACPACGTGRGMQHLLHFDLTGAFMLNPFSYIVAFSALLIPAWMIRDAWKADASLYRTYLSFNTYMHNHKWLFVAMCVLILSNWTWNIIKFT